MRASILLLICFWIFLGLVSACSEEDSSKDAGETDDDDSTDDDDDTADDDDNETDDDDDETVTGQIDTATLQDKILGSWVGQMAGVAWAAPTELRYAGRIIPADKVPVWEPWQINLAFLQDDIYVEIPFVQAMQESGIHAGWDVFGEAFRDTRFPLWHANEVGRDNLRKGIPAPDSGHYSTNEHCDDIDWQIEADFVGSMCPGLADTAIDLSFRAGHLMNFGDGVYGGVFMAAMHAASFFATDLMEIIEAGRRSLPEGSKYREVVEDVIAWHAEGKGWEETWLLLQNKWGEDDRCPDFSRGITRRKNIDAKLNGAYVLIGLLYGEGDFARSMEIAMRCGQDSDCNTSTVGAILGNWKGLSWIPDEFKEELNSGLRFIFTDYTLDDLVAANLELTDAILEAKGAERSGDLWTIPLETEATAPILEQWPAEANDSPELTAHVLTQDGTTVTFSAEATDGDGILDYEWYFGDFTRARGETVEHPYAHAGTYTVIVYAADAIGNTAWEMLTITVP